MQRAFFGGTVSGGRRIGFVDERAPDVEGETAWDGRSGVADKGGSGKL